MGGKVFSSGANALCTPRMSPPVYNHVKAQCTSTLKGLGFSRVATPIEAPEKDSFGDVDFLACLEGTGFPPNAQLDPFVWDKIEKSLGAVRSWYEGRIGPGKQRIIDSKSFAIPWPAGLGEGEGRGAAGSGKDGKASTSATATNSAGQEEHSGAPSSPRFFQVDLRLCDTRQDLEWRVFKHNHGDLWNMVGQTIRPFGLTANEVGLYIRIPEIERQDKKKARVHLSSDPTKVVDFLGLGRLEGERGKPFESVNDLFEYAASCKWFLLWPSDKDAEKEGTAGGDAKDQADKEIQRHLKKLKANDRARMKQRPIFARWVNEFIPACRAKGRFMVPDPEKRTPGDIRDEVRKQAFGTFPGSEAAYDKALADWNREKTRIFVKNKLIKEDACLPADITPSLPSPHERDDGTKATLQDLEKNWRGLLRSALAKVVIDDDDSFEGVRPPKLRNDEGMLQVDEIKDWINRNWDEVGRLAWIRNLERARESVERKRKADQDAQGAKAAANVRAGGKR